LSLEESDPLNPAFLAEVVRERYLNPMPYAVGEAGFCKD
jgi:hypothetical protein